MMGDASTGIPGFHVSDFMWDSCEEFWDASYARKHLRYFVVDHVISVHSIGMVGDHYACRNTEEWNNGFMWGNQGWADVAYVYTVDL
jgi:hypothetical protein